MALKNYISRDPNGANTIGPDQPKSYLQLVFHYLHRCLAVNRNSENYIDGTTLMNLIICIFENMQGLIDNEFPVLFKFVMDELAFT